MEKELERKSLSSLVSVKTVRWKGWGSVVDWWKGFKEKDGKGTFMKRVGVTESKSRRSRPITSTSDFLNNLH